MAEGIKVIPLAAESFGVRSMCTYIQTPDVKVLVDPGVSLGPRFGLLPHPREYACLRDCRERIARFADEADIVTISHYHFDHSTPTYTDYVWHFSDLEVARQIYGGKLVLAKDFRSNINASQRRRGWMLKRTIRSWVKDFLAADGQVFKFGETSLKFSTPVPHGEGNTLLGWVLMLTVEYGGARVIHASDVQGPIFDSTLEMLTAQSPSLVYVGGPPLYLLDYRFTSGELERGLKNIGKLAEKVPTVVIDHHLLRAENWREYLSTAFEAVRKAGHRIVTAAEFLGEADNILESRRQVLYEEEPPSVAFKKWLALPSEKQRMEKPPI